MGENICKINDCFTKILQFPSTNRTIQIGINAESPTALQCTGNKISMLQWTTSRQETERGNIRFGFATSRGVAPYKHGLTLSAR